MPIFNHVSTQDTCEKMQVKRTIQYSSLVVLMLIG